MSTMNRLANSHNPYQGSAKKVLCVCSAGLLRSPTMSRILSQEPYNYNTRAVGISKEFALIPLDEVLITWADEIVFVSNEVYEEALKKFEERLHPKDVTVLDIPDNFEYMDSTLVLHILEQYNEASKENGT